jgi:hypothetical protein
VTKPGPSVAVQRPAAPVSTPPVAPPSQPQQAKPVP